MHVIVKHGTHRLRRHVRQVWASRGGGFYGFVATLTFLYLEAMSLLGDVTSLPRLQINVGGIIGWLVQNLIAGVANVIMASIWPVAWLQHFGVGFTSAALLGGSYIGFHLLRPTVLRLLREPGDEPARGPAPPL